MKNNYKIGKIILISLPILFLVILFFAFSEKEKEENIENSEISLKEKKELDKIGEITENKKYKKISDLIFGETAIVNYGKVIAEKEIKITPEIPGKIEWVNVEVGDMVKKGDILIGLKKTDEENSLNAAILNSEISSLAYEKALSPVRDEDKEIAKKDVQLKNFLLNKTQLDIARQLGDIRLSLDEILRKEIDDFFDHTDIDSYVYVPTYTYRLKSRIKMEKMEELRKSLGIDFDFYYKNWESKSFEKKLSETNKILNKFYELSDLLYLNSKNLLGLSSGELEELEKKTLGIKTQIDGKKIILENLNSSYTSQRLAKDISQANFDKTRNGSREEDLESARISIELAENSIAKIQNLILKKTIVSPTDGIISRVDVNVGENISGGVPVIRIIKGKKILTSVPVDLSKKLFLGQEIKVNFLRGKISKIYPMSDNFGLVDLEIKILEKNNFEIGEFVKILIPEKIDKKSDNIILPLASIFEKKEKYFIYLLDNKLIAQEKEVEFVKLFGDGIMVKNSFKDEDRIILNSRGVSEGDKF